MLGVDLVTACDIRLCTEDAYFCVKEVDIGLAADLGTLQRLGQVVGSQSKVREWCLTARKIPAHEALQVGLVSQVFATRDEMLGRRERAPSLSLTLSRSHTHTHTHTLTHRF